MARFWQASEHPEQPVGTDQADQQPSDQPVRKQQITIRLDPEMIADARAIATRRGIGYHTLLRMWVMDGISRAYQEGLLDGPPQSWSPATRRSAAGRRGRAETLAAGSAPPAGSRAAGRPDR